MNFFEMINESHIMFVNGVATQNYGVSDDDFDDEEDTWCLSIYGYDPEDGRNFEFYLSRDEVENAEPYGDGFMVGDDTFEFYFLTKMN